MTWIIEAVGLGILSWIAKWAPEPAADWDDEEDEL